MKRDWDLTPDHQREQRLGFDETVFCASKTADQIERILASTGAAERLLLTRLEAGKYAQLSDAVSNHLDYDHDSRTAIKGALPSLEDEPTVAVVSAGTSDTRVAREAVRTLAYYGVPAREIYDVGVAGLWRLLEHEQTLRRMQIVITVAGMEGTLPSVIGGLVPGTVIAVPVSTGYGVAEGGVTALHSALASCAPGLVVVNIDNGYGAACAALRILNVINVKETKG